MKLFRLSRNMWVKQTFSLLLLAIIFPSTLLGAPVQILVKNVLGSQAYGAGISAGVGSRCFVVAPLHVAELAQSITITDRRGNTAQATPYQSPNGVDAILLKVEDNHQLDCPEDWDDGVAGDDALYDAEFLVSKKVKAGGVDQRRFFPGSVTSTMITVQPYRSGKADRLMEGDSGSALYVNNLPLGMIVSVNTGTGEGEAIKQSQLHALFGNYMIETSAKLALVSPVYQGYQENAYATSAAVEFIETKTPWSAVQTSPAVARNNLQNEMRGIATAYPDNVQYVVQSKIVANTSTTVVNPNYDARKAQTSNLGKQLINRVSAKDFRYYLVSNIDVEVTIIDTESQRRATHIERSEFKDPMTEGVNQRDLSNDALIRATVDAVQGAVEKFGAPILVPGDEHLALNGKKEKESKSEELIKSLLGFPSN